MWAGDSTFLIAERHMSKLELHINVSEVMAGHSQHLVRGQGMWGQVHRETSFYSLCELLRSTCWVSYPCSWNNNCLIRPSVYSGHFTVGTKICLVHLVQCTVFPVSLSLRQRATVLHSSSDFKYRNRLNGICQPGVVVSPCNPCTWRGWGWRVARPSLSWPPL